MSTQVQTNRIVPHSILRYRPIASEREPFEIPPWHRQLQLMRAKSAAFVASSPALATLVGCGMVIALLLILVGQLVVSWAQIALDDVHYGRPRTFQIDAYIGHEQVSQLPSHFLALNNRGHIEVIELPGNDPARARILLGPQLTGINADLVPVTVRFVDAHHTHYPDMILQVQGMSILFHNTHEDFELQHKKV